MFTFYVHIRHYSTDIYSFCCLQFYIHFVKVGKLEGIIIKRKYKLTYKIVIIPPCPQKRKAGHIKVFANYGKDTIFLKDT